MNWILILLLVIVGAVMAVLSVFGIIQSGFELILWVIFGIVSAYLIAKKGGRIPFMEGVIMGTITGIVNSAIQSSMFSTYLLNNPNSLDGFKEIPLSMPPQYLILFAGPFIGIIYGIMVGIVAMSLRKIVGTND